MILGIVLIITFGWFLRQNIKRYGAGKALTSLDIILGLIAGVYLVVAFFLRAK